MKEFQYTVPNYRMYNHYLIRRKKYIYIYVCRRAEEKEIRDKEKNFFFLRFITSLIINEDRRGNLEGQFFIDSVRDQGIIIIEQKVELHEVKL